MYKTACPKKTTDNTEHQAEDKKKNRRKHIHSYVYIRQ